MKRLNSLKGGIMSTLHRARGRTWMVFLLIAALAVAGSLALAGPSTASADDPPPVATEVVRENPPEPEGAEPEPNLIAPAADEVAPVEGDQPVAQEAPGEAADPDLIAPAPDEVAPVEGEQPVAQEAPGEAADPNVIAPAPDAATIGQDVIAPAPKSASGDDGSSWWIYGLAAAVGLVALAGGGTLAWRLRRQKA
jgi:hypothetical protein